jgi:divalent metal cation (Fe/Co/Zn/Cd) transporter
MSCEHEVLDLDPRGGHDPGHTHGDDGRWSRAWHALSEVVGGHAHDTADQVDEALESDAAGRRALWWSLAGLAATAAVQGAVVVVSGSVALLGRHPAQRRRRADGLVGAGGVLLGWPEADPVVGLLIAVAILGVLRQAVGQVGARLMDAVDPSLVDQAAAAVTSVRGVRGVRELRIRWIGHTLRAEVDVAVELDLTLAQAHDIAHHAEEHLLTRVRRLTAANVHVSPDGSHVHA